MKPICIYHGNCADGFGSAWVVRKALGDVDFFPGVYMTPPPDVAGRDVVMVDFSYKRPVLIEMAAKAEGILILDHHKTAADDLKLLPPNVDAIFDMEHSGAILTWEHYFPGQRPPQLLEHIEDRDLWRFNMSGTREIQANVFSYPYDFKVWDELMDMPVEDLLAEGRAIERKHFKDIHELLGVVTRRMVIGGYNVPIANLPYIHVSDACCTESSAGANRSARLLLGHAEGGRHFEYSDCGQLTRAWTCLELPRCILAAAMSATWLASPSITILRPCSNAQPLRLHESGGEMRVLTQEKLKSMLRYEPETGLFIRLVKCGRFAAGSRAGSISADMKGYKKYSMTVLGKTYLVSRLAWFYMTGEWPPYPG